MSDNKLDIVLPPLRDVIDRHGLNAKKSLGQNFLLDQNITRKIVNRAGDIDGHIAIEIGSGPGGLTRSILESSAKKCIAVEIDPRAINALQELKQSYPNRLEIIEGDATKIDWTNILNGGERYAFLGNLPYNVATPILTHILHLLPQYNNQISYMAFMFQKEVGQRICAAKNTKSYGRISIISQWLCDTSILFNLPPSAFTPPPKIESSVVLFNPKQPQDSWPKIQTLEHVTAKAFSQRRKMLRSSLAEYRDYLGKIDIKETTRAEDIDVDTFIKLAKYIEQQT